MKLKDQIIDIECDIREGKLTISQIAEKYDVPTYFVNDVWDFMCETEFVE